MKTEKRNDPQTELSETEKRLIRAVINRNQWTIARFADESDIALSTAQQYFSGERSPSHEARERMAAALGLSVTNPVIKSSRIVKPNRVKA